MATAQQSPPLPERQAQYVYKTIGERRLTLDMDYPADWKRSDKRPAIVFFFGGAWTNGSPGQFARQAAYFAKRGLVCARADYRIKSKDNVMPDACVADALSAMRWVRNNAASLGIDPNRIVSSGGSAGGHLAACVFFCEGVDHPDDDLSISPKPNAMILFNPALDMLALRDGQHDKLVAGMDDAALTRISPLRCLRKGVPPTLILDGTKDFFYPLISDFVDKNKKSGEPVEAFYAEDQPHGFFNDSPWIEKTTERADEFLRSIGYLAETPKVALPTKAAVPKGEKSVTGEKGRKGVKGER